MNIPKPTEAETEQGYQICPCNYNVHILQAGFEVRHKICDKCKFSVVDRDDFFNVGVAVEVLGK